MEIGRRRVLTGALGLTGAALVGARGTPAWAIDPRPQVSFDPLNLEYPLAPPGSPGLVDEATWQGWVDDYLHGLTNPDVISQLVRSHREPAYVWDAAAVTVDDFAAMFDAIDNWKDTRDFRFMDIHWMLHLADGATPTRTLDPTVIDAFESRMAGARWRYDDPLPDGVTDNQWFWSENHLIIGLCGEYLAGQRMPDRVFGITGLTGAEHMARSKPDILAWIAERARFGFFEFHSSVYMRFNIKPLTMLAEMADDPELIRAAGMGIDLCLLDVAAHNHRGSYVAAEGRVYAIANADSWPLSRFLWRDSDGPVGTGVDNTTVVLCAAQRYRPPQVLLDIAVSPGETLVRERHGVYYDAATPITPDPVAPFGYDFDDPENLEFWWSQGGVGLWPLAHVNLEQAQKFRLFDTDALADIKLLVQVNGNDPDQLAAFLQKNQAILNFGHLQEVNTYHWRNDVVALASAPDYRFGFMRDQVRPWKAVIDEQAVVYTTHPRTEPAPDMFGRDGKPGYWTGEASQPRCAQFERTAVHIYQPAWDETTDNLLWLVFPYRDFTHAFFPRNVSTRWSRTETGRSVAGATDTSASGRGERRRGGPTTPASTTPAALWNPSTWWPRAAPTTCGSPRSATCLRGRSATGWPPGCRRQSMSCATPKASRSAGPRRPAASSPSVRPVPSSWTAWRRSWTGSPATRLRGVGWSGWSCCTRSGSATRRWSSTSGR